MGLTFLICGGFINGEESATIIGWVMIAISFIWIVIDILSDVKEKQKQLDAIEKELWNIKNELMKLNKK
jgi:uncharacterized protein YoxC